MRRGFAAALPTPPFDGYRRHACYVPGADGVLLAVDWFLPTRAGRVSPQPLPAIFQMTPYNRAHVANGQVVHVLSPFDADGRTHENNLHSLCLQGYAIVAADVRGQGASFGTYAGIMSVEEGRDGAAIIAWLRTQPWCNGRIGMLGSSYGAATQFLVAAERPEGLQALYACHIYFDAYDAFFPGGVRELQIPRSWAKLVDDLAGRTADSVAAPVDGPAGAAMLADAVREHRRGPAAAELFTPLYRTADRAAIPLFDTLPESGSVNLRTLLPRLRAARIPAYHHGGWNDFYPEQTLSWFEHWDFAPAKLVIGPWSHSPRCFTTPRDDADLRIRAAESLRWFDYWLKDADTGVLEEPPVHFAVQTGHPYSALERGRPDAWVWSAVDAWPPRDATELVLHLAPGRTGTIDSINDGGLRRDAADGVIDDTLVVDARVGTGERNRMGGSFNGAPVALPDMRGIDARCLTYTTESLTGDLVLIGSPQLQVSVVASEWPLPLFVWLQEIDGDGASACITYGIARVDRPEGASARARIALQPTAIRCAAGCRIRLTISASDCGNYQSAQHGSTLRVLGSFDAPARLSLPVRSC